MKRLLLPLALIALAVAVNAQQHEPQTPAPAQHGAEPSAAPHTPQPGAGAHGATAAAQHTSEAHTAGNEHAEDNSAIWKWANFAILAGVLGWMIAKGAPAFFRNRTEQIQRGIAEATRLRNDAEARAAKMEMRMASLQQEIDHLRAEARSEMAKEADRLRRETEQHLARVQAHGEQEIEAITKHAEQRLRAEAGRLAVELAEQRIRNRMTPEVQNRLVDGFLRQVTSDPAKGVRA